jgi:hypothetical protein
MTRSRLIAALLLSLPVSLLVAGCSVESRPADVSADAERVMVGADLRWSAPRRGEVFVYDKDTNKMVYSGRVVAGDQLKVDPDDGDITLNGRTAVENVVGRGREFEIWFDDARR